MAKHDIIAKTLSADAGTFTVAYPANTLPEKYLGGTSATENTVTAWKLNVPGNIGMTEISTALNRY